MLLFIELAAKFIVDHNIIAKFGTGKDAVETPVAMRQEQFIKNKFGLNNAQFSEAMAEARKISSIA